MRNQRLVRNPLLGLPATQDLQAYLDGFPGVRSRLVTLLMEIGAQADEKAAHSWQQHKAPMAAYWKAVGVYARHTAKCLR